MSQFLQPPGMDWVRPAPLGELTLEHLAPAQAGKMARSMARERLARLQGDKVEAEIGRIHSLTQADLAGKALDQTRQRGELDYLKERYPLLIEQLERDIDQGRAESGALVDARSSQADVYRARGAQIGAETEIAKGEAALKLDFLEKRYPGLLRKLEGEIEQSENESEAQVLATQALANARNASAAATASGAAQDAMAAGIERGFLPGQLDADLDATRALAEMRRARGQAALDGGAFGPATPGGAPDPLNPYSVEANRWNDDVTSLVGDLYGRDAISDVVTGEMMVGTGPEREQRRLELIRAAQNIGAVSRAAGRPMSPQEAVAAAVESLRGGAPGGGAPGGGVPNDPLGIRGGM